jgi:hypothetical protein
VPYLIVMPAIFAAPFTASAPLLIALFGGAMVMRGFAEPNMYLTIIDAVPSRERGAAQGFLLMLTFAGSSSAGLIGGVLMDRLAGPLAQRTAAMATGAYHTLFAVFGCAAVAAGVLGMALFAFARRGRAVR